MRRGFPQQQSDRVGHYPDAPHARDASTDEFAQTGTTVRLIQDVTPSGKVRVLMTNLLDAERFPAADFGALYHRRWRIEEAFKRLKHHLWLESRYPA
ncbi:transposase [Chitinimonas sp. BJB300]|uniref:transposase n=1 Tax=Chitinimonas sp. BJB300 TaxID=1559339 RepID=UPI0035B51C64